ncbi:MAG TPA: VIT and VWA domain-containing protein [Bryobacteraceae bacterium]|nr:VIT and VWA domain-containing protein [Bryobacteraceae bacterium]
MQRKFKTYIPLAAVAAAAYLFPGLPPSLRADVRRPAKPAQTGSQGMLMSINPKGEPAGPCPLEHTGVKAEISGFLSRVTVTQEFRNPYQEKIEAVYTFPLPHDAAVDEMTMKIGDRTVRGKIKRREEARAIYDAARDKGYAAALLDQERPNIFTQAVANIRPGEKVTITLKYVETLKYEAGAYEFVFPMVVAPRYIPGKPAGRQGGGWAPDTTRVPDASRITPPVTLPGTRAGHDISVEITLDAGVPINFLRSVTHDVDIERPTPRTARLRLKNKNEIPNRDLVLLYDVSGRKIEDAVLTHHDSRGGFFTMILQPPAKTPAQDITPKELVFVLDTSGSMSGFPIEKAKEAMKHALDGLNPRDTFNLITFAGDTAILFPQPVPATPENLRQAQQFLASRSGRGGTEMMKAIRASLDPSDKQDHLRVVCFMTDGEVGNDMQIIAEVQKHPNARVFAFGIGSSVNRFLLSKMAEYGRGEVEFVGLEDDGSAAAKRFHERVHSPLLTDIRIDWGGLPVSDVYPARIPDLFSARPVVLSGRYTRAGKRVIRLRGTMGGKEFTREIAVTLPDSEPKHDVLATLWARRRVDDLMGQDWEGTQSGRPRSDMKEAVTKVGLEYNLMTQFTSFVAVEETVVTDGGKPRRVEVPVEMPHGMSYEGVFGENRLAQIQPLHARAKMSYGAVGGGYRASRAMPSPPPASRSAQPLDESKPVSLEKMEQPSRKVDPSLLGQSGKVRVQIWLDDTSAQVLATLKALGVEVSKSELSERFVLATVESSKLLDVARVAAVRYISPVR